MSGPCLWGKKRLEHRRYPGRPDCNCLHTAGSLFGRKSACFSRVQPGGGRRIVIKRHRINQYTRNSGQVKQERR